MQTNSAFLDIARKVFYEAYTFRFFDIWQIHLFRLKDRKKAHKKMTKLHIMDVNPRHDLFRQGTVTSPYPRIAWPAQTSAFDILRSFTSLQHVEIYLGIMNERNPLGWRNWIEGLSRGILAEVPVVFLDTFKLSWDHWDKKVGLERQEKDFAEFIEWDVLTRETLLDTPRAIWKY